MPALSAHDLLHIWEAGLEQSPVDRALTILASAYPSVPRETSAALTVGQRDAMLLRLREHAFGHEATAWAECPGCGERVEWSFPLGAIILPTSVEGGEVHELEWNDLNISFRLPDSRDLAAISGRSDTATAHAELVGRCVLAVERDGEPLDSSELSAGALEALARAMAEADPQAEVLFDLQCPACSLSWQLPFDIASYLWIELAAAARRLLGEVHILARAYGWHEADILALGPARRRFYLEMAS